MESRDYQPHLGSTAGRTRVEQASIFATFYRRITVARWT